jgi:TRAP-type C4-dicarboxylate transport system permease small subunit
MSTNADPKTSPPAAGEEHVLDASGHVHLTDAPIDLSSYSIEGWVAFVFFWVLAFNVCYQFFTRYFLNDSASWTEEIARYLLICTVFIGIAAAVRDDRHIRVDFLYRLIPRPLGRALATLVDAVQIAFFAYVSVLTWQMMLKMGNYKMTIIDLPMNLIYGVCLVGFACSAVRAAQVALRNWRRGYSALEHPDADQPIEPTA